MPLRPLAVPMVDFFKIALPCAAIWGRKEACILLLGGAFREAGRGCRLPLWISDDDEEEEKAASQDSG